MKEKQKQTKLYDQPDIHAKRSTFDLSFPNKMTLNFNKIVPTCCKKTMPGDSWHVKTSVFSRWLAMQAPTFSEYDIKFLNAYVPNNIIWGGWQQFAGQGDAQASQYLLPGTITNLANNKVPYITTAGFCKIVARKILSPAITWYDPDTQQALRFKFPVLTSLGNRYFRFVVIPIFSRSIGQNPNGIWTYNTVRNDSDLEFFGNGQTAEISYCPCLVSRRDDAYWLDIINNGYAFEIPYIDSNNNYGYNGNVLKRLAAFVSRPKTWVFVNQGSNIDTIEQALNMSPSPNFIELPKWWYPCSQFIDYDNGNNSPLDGWHDPSITKTAWETYDKARYIPRIQPLKTTDGTVSTLQFDTSIKIVPTIDSFAPSEGYISPTSYLTLNWQDIFNRTVGNELCVQIFGAGSLTDYLGKCYSQSLLRQPFETANAILGYFDIFWTNRGSVRTTEGNIGSVVGTYNEKSMKYDRAVINDVPISILPYLAYHKIWNDYIRDNRYEQRFLYADPYRSPFMQPLFGQGNNDRNGSFIQGELLEVNTNTWNNFTGVIPYGQAVLAEPSYSIENSAVQSKITPSAPFNVDGLIQLLSLRERRVVHDFFTMVTPTSQYGDPAYALLDTNQGGQQGTSTLAIRMATRLQKFLEHSNFAGSDFIKQTLAHFGVKPDHCQHCSVKYLGGKVMTPTISPVIMSSQDSPDTNQVTGQQAAQMYCSGNLEKVSFSTNEHGYYFQFVTVQNDFFTTDGQEVDPITYLDYPNPIFADLGPEPLPLARVVNTDATPNTEANNTHPLSVFGYIPRYAQWKCSLAEIHGDFRKTLSYWVSKRQFDSDLQHGSFGYGLKGNTPQIGRNFLYENPDYQAFAYSGDEYDHALLDIDHQITVSRELPMLPSPNVL